MEGAPWRCVWLLALSVAFVGTSTVHAQDTASRDASSRDAEARGIYQAGVSAYEGGRYREALDYFRRSHELSGRPQLLYNIGSAAERAREDEVAVESYERFLAEVTDTPLRERVETRIAELRAQLEAARTHAEADAEPERVPVLEATPSRTGRVGPLLVLGAGAAVAVVGGVMLGIGLSDKSQVESPPEGSRDWANDSARAYRRGPALLSAGVVALPLGALGAALGTVLVVRSKRGGADAQSLRVGVGVGTLTIEGAF